MIIVTRVLGEQEGKNLKTLALQLTQNAGVVALLGTAGAKTQLVFARAADAHGDMKQLLSVAFGILGQGSGGGSPTFAQGGGPASSEDQLHQALKAAQTAVIHHIESGKLA